VVVDSYLIDEGAELQPGSGLNVVCLVDLPSASAAVVALVAIVEAHGPRQKAYSLAFVEAGRALPGKEPEPGVLLMWSLEETSTLKEEG